MQKVNEFLKSIYINKVIEKYKLDLLWPTVYTSFISFVYGGSNMCLLI